MRFYAVIASVSEANQSLTRCFWFASSLRSSQ